MKQSLQLKLGQQLTMTPQLQQAIRLLQLSTLDLQQEIQEALDSNPMLELEENYEGGNETNYDTGEPDTSDYERTLEVAADPAANTTDQLSDNYTSSTSTDSYSSSESNDYASSNGEGFEAAAESDFDADSFGDSAGDWSDSIPADLPVDTSWDDVYQASSSSSSSNYDNEDNDFESRRATTDSIYDHLTWQLNLTPMSDRDRLVAMAIIDAVEPSGMLSISIHEIYDGLAAELEELEEDEVVAVQHRLQQFDPCGVCSQNLSECLLVQLQQFDPQTPFLEPAKLIVKQYLPLLGSRDYRQLMRRTKLKEAELSQAVTLIQGLNPRPGDIIASGDTEYVVPDVFVEKRDSRWIVELNPDIAPRLRINSDYASMVRRADSSSDNTFLKDNLQEARWFLKSLQSRNETLLKVASCIVEKQRGFLEYGPEAMKPLVLHDIAEIVGMHESTISRVTTQKYMHTPQGIFELKYFFSSHVSTDSGGECSSTAIRAIIKKLVSAENPKKPLSDSKITELLAEQGIQVARRTIAKYRESLNIPPSNERKSL
ncbi:RNA polymerase factor sigma-54 [Cellvibrio japonicus]|uniref:RNA polymerase sigma-54 factor n=1 Tax=Cellvibrio japonicus (strain Ueda107) TaxID=498211 RepID=B3PBZ5_CELJU|nr:RNA polymerase factor sigma-54 [Cellvibrio japonicus]ACE83100.1 RNA polymerase sigma-54 factor [Cellvibrio japonicus Ueda107]QEI13150.1 RNA polymerase factor sigma-54 [Cellvibrio japonicus]QEI16724.1 RNA polymerase factor sigma-54 [Cellvibrio japonicus]QEI20302.1 RNA polymerase factor sigma-54 [Cellvibrio japonicus]